MEQPSLKRSADFSIPGDAVQKRSKLTGPFINPRVDTDAASSSRRSSFSSRSPGSPKQHTLQSAEVAADFKESLQDLHGNDRYQISNLTLIAKESTEHAMAIARVLEAHIRATSPQRKLPALYVLDSIVKNVGTPYTIYFGQNLYKTFMEAYTLVDGQTRKAMEAMLKTWKEPIPGSMEARPVFPVDIVRPIENALIKARTAFVQQQQQQARSQRQTHALPPRPAVIATPQPWSNVPTPPQHDAQFSPPPIPQQSEHKNLLPATDSQLANLFPGMIYPQQTSTPVPNTAPPVFQQSQQPPQQQTPYIPSSTPTHTQSLGQYQNTYSLVALLQAAGTYPPAPHPPELQQQPQLYQQPIPSPQPFYATSQPPSLFPGLEALFKYTATPDVPTPVSFAPPAHTQPSISTPIPALSSRATHTPPILPAVPAQPPLAGKPNDVQLNASSLKTSRPYLINALYGARPSQCATCGRRFGLDADSRRRKGRHLDAHFRTNRSIAEAARRGISRNWYVDELDWIRSREVDDADEPPVAASSSGGEEMGGELGRSAVDGLHAGEGISNGAKGSVKDSSFNKSKDVYVKAPADAAVARHTCPICQEEFRTVWHDGAQEWVWMDAVLLGGRAYHKSCMEELAKDRGSTATPIGGAASKLERGLKREV